MEELQNALKAECVAREQGDQRCMEALRDLTEDLVGLGLRVFRVQGLGFRVSERTVLSACLFCISIQVWVGFRV